MTELNSIAIEKHIEGDLPNNDDNDSSGAVFTKGNSATADAVTGPIGSSIIYTTSPNGNSSADAATSPSDSSPLYATSPNGRASTQRIILESVPNDNDNSSIATAADATTGPNDSSLLCATSPNGSKSAQIIIV